MYQFIRFIRLYLHYLPNHNSEILQNPESGMDYRWYIEIMNHFGQRMLSESMMKESMMIAIEILQNLTINSCVFSEQQKHGAAVRLHQSRHVHPLCVPYLVHLQE